MIEVFLTLLPKIIQAVPMPFPMKVYVISLRHFDYSSGILTANVSNVL